MKLDTEKIIKIIDSCKTFDQLSTIYRFINKNPNRTNSQYLKQLICLNRYCRLHHRLICVRLFEQTADKQTNIYSADFGWFSVNFSSSGKTEFLNKVTGTETFIDAINDEQIFDKIQALKPI